MSAMPTKWRVLYQVEDFEDDEGLEWTRKANGGKYRERDMDQIFIDFPEDFCDFPVTEDYRERDMNQMESGAEREIAAIDLASRDRVALKKAVSSGNLDFVLEKFKKLYPEIWEGNPELAFRLQQQRFIELTRDGKIEEALLFVQENLAPFVMKNRKFLEELERTATLLVFEDASSGLFAELLDTSRREKIAGEVNAAILRSQNQGKSPIGQASIRDPVAVKKAVQSGNLESDLEKFKKSVIWNRNPELAFRLLQQRFIELTRHGKIKEAVLFSQEELAPFVMENQKFIEDLERTISLLAFGDFNSFPFPELVDKSRRLKVASEAKAFILRCQKQEKDSQMKSELESLSYVQR